VTLLARVRDSRFLRFAVVGGLGFFMNEAVLYAAIHFLGLGPYSAGIFAFLVTVTFTWGGNRLLTFGDKAARGIMAMVEEWAKFVAANALGFGVNYAVYVSLVTFAPGPLNSPYVALAFGTLAGLIFNFTLSKRFVFNAAD
jgi:putative flippase GtrA